MASFDVSWLDLIVLSDRVEVVRYFNSRLRNLISSRDALSLDGRSFRVSHDRATRGSLDLAQLTVQIGRLWCCAGHFLC